MSTWILVANASEAFLYQAKHLKSKELELVHSFAHPKSREKGIDLVTDHPGSFQFSNGSRSSCEKCEPKAVEAEEFAIELRNYLDQGRRQNKFDELLVIAPPFFYGLLKEHLNKHLEQAKHLVKDYTKCTPAELAEHIATQL